MKTLKNHMTNNLKQKSKLCFFVAIFAMLFFATQVFADASDRRDRSWLFIKAGTRAYQAEDFYGAVRFWEEAKRYNPGNKDIGELIYEARFQAEKKLIHTSMQDKNPIEGLLNPLSWLAPNPIDPKLERMENSRREMTAPSEKRPFFSDELKSSPAAATEKKPFFSDKFKSSQSAAPERKRPRTTKDLEPPKAKPPKRDPIEIELSEVEKPEAEFSDVRSTGQWELGIADETEVAMAEINAAASDKIIDRARQIQQNVSDDEAFQYMRRGLNYFVIREYQSAINAWLRAAKIETENKDIRSLVRDVQQVVS